MSRFLQVRFVVLLGLWFGVAVAGNDSASITLQSKDMYQNLLAQNGTTVLFLKCFAPWCGHCVELAPHWDAMANQIVTVQQSSKSSRQLVIAELDCTQHQSWCVQEFGITGFPTLLYGDPSYGGIFLHEYTGEKTSEGLLSFARETLLSETSSILCTPGNIQGCTNVDESNRLQSYWDMSVTELQSQLQGLEQSIQQLHQEFDQKVTNLQRTYDSLAKTKGDNAIPIKRNIKWMQDVLKTKQ